jgi:hypothetical protein
MIGVFFVTAQRWMCGWKNTISRQLKKKEKQTEISYLPVEL